MFVLRSRWVDLFREQCRQGADGKWSKSLNMTHEVNYLVFDILGDLCFGKNFNMKEPDSDLKHIPELMAGFLQTLAPVSDPFHVLGSIGETYNRPKNTNTHPPPRSPGLPTPTSGSGSNPAASTGSCNTRSPTPC
jgi:hypothetical protein